MKATCCPSPLFHIKACRRRVRRMRPIFPFPLIRVRARVRVNREIGRIRRNVAHWSVVSVLPLSTCICGPNSHPPEPALVTMWAIVKTLWLEPLPLKSLVE